MKTYENKYFSETAKAISEISDDRLQRDFAEFTSYQFALLFVFVTFFFNPFNCVSQSSIGISGMAKADLSATNEVGFLVVHDSQDRGQKPVPPRFGIMVIGTNSRYLTVKEDWSSVSFLGNDLEGICQIPDRPNHFLIVESGYYQRRKYGRIMEAVLSRDSSSWKVTIIRQLQLPLNVESIEGIACSKIDNNDLLVVIGEREATMVPENIRWDILNYSNWTNTLSFNEGTNFFSPISDRLSRDVSDLYLDSDSFLWCSGTFDNADPGPFKSVIYLIGKINPQANPPVYIAAKPYKAWQLPGYKIEALASPILQGSALSIGTDDEDYGGTWRALFHH